MAATPWEAEDLFQDTLMKIYLALKTDPHRQLTKRFFYRIAQNTWIDQQRMNKLETDSMTEQEPYITNLEQKSHQFQISESLEILAEYLSVKQFVIVLLMDIFQFTAKETADMIRDTETNVYTTLHRSRKKLKRCVRLTADSTKKLHNLGSVTNSIIDKNLFETFMQAFQTRNINLIYKAYLSISKEGIQITKVNQSSPSLCFYFTDLDGNVFMICQSLKKTSNFFI